METKCGEMLVTESKWKMHSCSYTGFAIFLRFKIFQNKKFWINYVCNYTYICVCVHVPQASSGPLPRVAESESLGNGAWDSAW